MDAAAQLVSAAAAAAASAPVLTGAVAVVGSVLLVRASSCRRQARGGAPQPVWEWFCLSNIVAVLVFLSCVSYLLPFWVEHMRMGGHFSSLSVAQPAFIASAVGALGSLLYFFAFFGVAFVHQDVKEIMRGEDVALRAAQRRAAGGQNAGASSSSVEGDADVVIVGMGIAGATLATVLARQGKRVVVLESAKEPEETIKGELLQPGGIRALERMGLGSCAKRAEVDGIRVDGYVCITPGAAARADAATTAAGSSSSSSSSSPAAARSLMSISPEDCVVLSYPLDDPHTTGEFLGVTPPNTGRVVTADTVASAPAGTVGTGLTEVCPVTGRDLNPHGRSFHHTRFVRSLREAALAEPNVRVVWASARRLLSAGEYRESAEGRKAPVSYASPASVDAERVVGVVYGDESGADRSVVARVTVAANGMFSNMRKDLHETMPVKVSHFCGLILHHPAAQSPLPFPNRGHVVMIDPNPVLFYQISPTDTRVLVDVPVADYDKGPKLYFETVVAPQLPESLRQPFLDALATQRIFSMPCMAISGVPPKKKGAVMVGDILNMRHPLTGGGMTVAIKDVELFANTLLPLGDLGVPGEVTEGRLERAIAKFYEGRGKHASTINILANALHRVFTKPQNDDGTRGRLRAACIEYLSMGGPYSAGPVGLLSGLTPAPWVLVAHFFAVAAYAMRKALLPPTPTRLRQGYDLMHVACIIIMPLLASERATVLSWTPVQWGIHVLFPWKGAKL